MTRLVLLDTNMIIGAFDHDPENAKHVEARQCIESLLQDDKVELVITSLIRYEVLRGLKRKSSEDMTAILNSFKELNVSTKVAETAAKIFQKRIALGHKGQTSKCDHCQCEPSKCDKRHFDILHFATAHEFDLSLETHDDTLKNIAQYLEPTIELEGKV